MRLIPHPSPVIVQGVGVVLIFVGLVVAAAVVILPVKSLAPAADRDCGSAISALRRHAIVLDPSYDDATEADFENGCHDAAKRRIVVGSSIALVLVVAGAKAVRDTADS